MSRRLPATQQAMAHGGDLDAARRAFPAAPEPWIDLSTGINPYAYPFAMPGAEAWQRLPQASAERALCAAAAARYGADPEMVLAAPGSQMLIQLAPRLIEATDVAVVGPTYAEHAAAWSRHGNRVRTISALADVGDARAVVLVNPDNPTGRALAQADLHAVARALAERRGLLIVDEAFADFSSPSVSIVPHLPPATLVLRSFGKAYGLAGLRLGFAVAPVDLIRRLRVELGPWAVAGPALAIGTAALADGAWLAATREKLVAAGRRLDALAAASGLRLQGGTELFRLVEHARAGETADALGRAGIHVRRFAEHPRWLRFGLPGSEAAWRRLQLALQPYSV
jgi:cobalamin biosynthetic protein CobC